MYPDNHWERRYHELEAFLSWIYSQDWCPPEVKQCWLVPCTRPQPPQVRQLLAVPFTRPQPPPLLRSSNSSLHQQTPSPFSVSNQGQISTTSGPTSLANDSGRDDSLKIRVYKPKPPESLESPEPPEPPELRELDKFLDQITKAQNWNVDSTSEASVDLLNGLFGNLPETQSETWRLSDMGLDYHQILDSYAIFTEQNAKKAKLQTLHATFQTLLFTCMCGIAQSAGATKARVYSSMRRVFGHLSDETLSRYCAGGLWASRNIGYLEDKTNWKGRGIEIFLYFPQTAAQYARWSKHEKTSHKFRARLEETEPPSTSRQDILPLSIIPCFAKSVLNTKSKLSEICKWTEHDFGKAYEIFLTSPWSTYGTNALEPEEREDEEQGFHTHPTDSAREDSEDDEESDPHTPPSSANSPPPHNNTTTSSVRDQGMNALQHAAFPSVDNQSTPGTDEHQTGPGGNQPKPTHVTTRETLAAAAPTDVDSDHTRPIQPVQIHNTDGLGRKRPADDTQYSMTPSPKRPRQVPIQGTDKGVSEDLAAQASTNEGGLVDTHRGSISPGSPTASQGDGVSMTAGVGHVSTTHVPHALPSFTDTLDANAALSTTETHNALNNIRESSGKVLPTTVHKQQMVDTQMHDENTQRGDSSNVMQVGSGDPCLPSMHPANPSPLLQGITPRLPNVMEVSTFYLPSHMESSHFQSPSSFTDISSYLSGTFAEGNLPQV